MSSSELQVGRGHVWRELEKRIIISNSLFILSSTPRCSKASSLPSLHLSLLLATSQRCWGLNPDPSVLQRGASAPAHPPALLVWAQTEAPNLVQRSHRLLLESFAHPETWVWHGRPISTRPLACSGNSGFIWGSAGATEACWGEGDVLDSRENSWSPRVCVPPEAASVRAATDWVVF